MKRQRDPDVAKYQLPPAMTERAERLAARLPHEIISVWGPNMRCYFASPSSTSIPGGWRPDEMLGRHASEYVHMSDWPHVALARSDTELTGKSIDMTVDVRNRFGEMVRVRSRTVLIKDPSTSKLFFLTRSVPVGQDFADLE